MKFLAIVACASVGACSGRIYTGPNSYIDFAEQATPVGNIHVTSLTPQGECWLERGLEEALACRDGQNDQRLSRFRGEMERERAVADRIYRLARAGVEHDPRTGYFAYKFNCYALATPMWINACKQGSEHGRCDANLRRLQMSEDRLRSAYERGRASIGASRGFDGTYNPPSSSFYSSCPSGPDFALSY